MCHGNIILVIVIGIQISHVSWLKSKLNKDYYTLYDSVSQAAAVVPDVPDVCSMRDDDYCTTFTKSQLDQLNIDISLN